jgi:hypothetical protein
VVIAIAQEDKQLEEHGMLPASFGRDLPFDVVADLNRAETEAYDRTTAYLIDKNGIVRQVFPMLIHNRPSWEAILREVDRVQREYE